MTAVSSLEDAILKAMASIFPHTQGTANNARTEFYDKFQREADEYDHDYMKKYDEDLNTTLIFVSIFFRTRHNCGADSFFWVKGRSVLRRHIRLHYRRSDQPPTGFPRAELQAPQDRCKCHTWEYANWRRRHTSRLGWPRSYRSSCPSHPLLKFGRFSPLSVRSHAGQAVAQPLCPGGNARIRR